MATERPARDRQRGNSLVLALIVMSALATLGSLTVVSVQSSLKASTNDRSQAVALYAAESGAAYAMDFLRKNPANWNSYITTDNKVGIIPVAPDPLFPTNRAQPRADGNPFSDDQNAWFDIQFFNNRDEPIDPAIDVDRQVIIRSTGHGPQESVAIVDYEVKLLSIPPPSPPGPPNLADPLVFILVGWHTVDL